MNTVIEDGRGTGSKLQIDSKGRIQAFSVISSEYHTAIDSGDSYIISTGFVTLTSANQSAVLYIQNNEPNGIRISSIIYHYGTSTGGTSTDIKCDFVKNPTSTTAAVVLTPVNGNSESTNILNANFYAGTEASTITGGTVFFQHIHQTKSEGVHQQEDVLYAMQTNSTLGIRVTPPPGNTSLTLAITITVFLPQE